jgi:hypothetical protein
MPDIRAGQITAFYLFDVAESIHLAAVPGLIGGKAVPAQLGAKPARPAYVQYQQPPISFDGERVGMPEIGGFRVRFRVYDYGVVSLALNRPFSGSWVDLIAFGQGAMESEALERDAKASCRRLIDQLRSAMKAPRDSSLFEDYVIFAIHQFDRPLTADELVEEHGEEIALLLRGEQHALSRQEKHEVLRHRLSYLANDLVVPSWNAALVYDTEVGAQAAFEILEFANSQLLEFRYYDGLLDKELGDIYVELESRQWYEVFGRRYTRAARKVHALFIEINELTDKTENSLKIVGDVYDARLFALVAARLGLDGWKASVQDKLKTLDDIYRFAVEQTGMTRDTFLEATIVLILVFELVLFMLGIMN